jgi:hypothetical protein
MRSWHFWKHELKKRLLLGPENDGIGDSYGRRIRLWLPGGGKTTEPTPRRLRMPSTFRRQRH